MIPGFLNEFQENLEELLGCLPDIIEGVEVVFAGVLVSFRNFQHP